MLLAIAAFCQPIRAVAQDTGVPPSVQVSIKTSDLLRRDKSGLGNTVVVSVTDSADRPIVGADVNFTAPNIGASIVFSNGSTSYQKVTGADGIASVVGLRPNRLDGRFTMTITASFGGEFVKREVELENDRSPVLTRKRITLAALGSAAVLIPVLALRSSTPSATIASVNPTVPVGPP